MCDIHTKIRERTHRVFVWHSRKKEWDVSLKKEAKKCGSPHKIRVMYERKGNNKEVYSSWKSDKIQWDSSTRKLKDMCGSPHIEKGVTFTQKKENMVQRVYDIYDSHK